MTRNDDHYVALEDRVNYAKSVGASVFVSIHNNSTTSSSVHGATVYYPNSSLNANIGAQGGALANEVLKQLVALGLAMMERVSEILRVEIPIQMDLFVITIV